MISTATASPISCSGTPPVSFTSGSSTAPPSSAAAHLLVRVPNGKSSNPAPPRARLPSRAARAKYISERLRSVHERPVQGGYPKRRGFLLSELRAHLDELSRSCGRNQ